MPHHAGVGRSNRINAHLRPYDDGDLNDEPDDHQCGDNGVENHEPSHPS